MQRKHDTWMNRIPGKIQEKGLEDENCKLNIVLKYRQPYIKCLSLLVEQILKISEFGRKKGLPADQIKGDLGSFQSPTPFFNFFW